MAKETPLNQAEFNHSNRYLIIIQHINIILPINIKGIFNEHTPIAEKTP